MKAEELKPEELKANEYKCDKCKGVFQFDWSEEEAEAEMQKNFPGMKKEDAGIICDVCYKEIFN